MIFGSITKLETFCNDFVGFGVVFGIDKAEVINKSELIRSKDCPETLPVSK